MAKQKFNAHQEYLNSTHVWLAFAPCGCVSGIASDIPMNGTDVGKWIKQGRRVERVTDEQWRSRTYTFPSKCPHEKKGQLALACT